MRSPVTAATPTTTSLAARYQAIRDQTEALASVLSPEDQVVQSMADVSPTKWHRAHTTWFFAEFVLRADGTSGRVWDRPEYRFLYNSYYEAVGARHPRPQRGLVTRPSVAEVANYRNHVDKEMLELMTGGLDTAIAAVVELGTHHEEQHQELLLMDIKHVLSMNPAVGPAYADRPHAPAVDPGPSNWVDFAGGLADIGVDHGADGFSIADGAIGEYNGKFMSGQQVLRGGCVFTPPGHTRSTYRNFFHPHTRWHASGVRLATDRQ